MLLLPRNGIIQIPLIILITETLPRRQTQRHIPVLMAGGISVGRERGGVVDDPASELGDGAGDEDGFAVDGGAVDTEGYFDVGERGGAVGAGGRGGGDAFGYWGPGLYGGGGAGDVGDFVVAF